MTTRSDTEVLDQAVRAIMRENPGLAQVMALEAAFRFTGARFGWHHALAMVRDRYALMKRAHDCFWDTDIPAQEDDMLNALAALGWQHPPEKLTSADLFGGADGFGGAIDDCMFAAAPMVTNPPWRR